MEIFLYMEMLYINSNLQSKLLIWDSLYIRGGVLGHLGILQVVFRLIIPVSLLMKKYYFAVFHQSLIHVLRNQILQRACPVLSTIWLLLSLHLSLIMGPQLSWEKEVMNSTMEWMVNIFPQNLCCVYRLFLLSLWYTSRLCKLIVLHINSKFLILEGGYF